MKRNGRTGRISKCVLVICLTVLLAVGWLAIIPLSLSLADEPTALADNEIPAPLTLVLKGVKVLHGDLPQAETFGFIARPASVNPQVGDPLTGEVTVKTGGEHAFSFSPKTFTKPGVYTYAVSEVNGGLEGVLYDHAEHTLAITVSDNNDGTMRAAATLDGQPFNPTTDRIRFVNAWLPDDVPLTLTVKNVLRRYDESSDSYEDAEQKAGAFRFQVVDRETGTVVTTGSNSAEGRVVFNTFYFTPDMLDGTVSETDGSHSKTFTYRVSEVVPVIAKDPNMRYDTAVFDIEVTLTHAADGTLSVSVNGDSDGEVDLCDDVAFVNYANPDAVDVHPIGTIEAESAPVDATFSFTLTNVANGNRAAVGVGASNGAITFSKMSFSQVGDYAYWVTEANADNTTNGIVYDKTRYLMTVAVSRDAYNRLTAQVAYFAAQTDGAADAAAYTVPVEQPTFRNVYGAAGRLCVTAENELDGRALRNGEFAFELVREDNGGVIHGFTDTGGNIAFSDLYYSQNDLPDGERSTVLRYTMRQVIPKHSALVGVTYDTAIHEVYVRIADNGDGTVKAELVEPSDGGYTAKAGTDTGVVFYNRYVAVEGDELRFRVKNTLEGRELRAGEFDFLMSSATTIVNVATNDKAGNVEFFVNVPARAAVGTHAFYVYEAIGSLKGMVYDEAYYMIYVNVADRGNGAIDVTLVDEQGAPLPLGADGVYDLSNRICFRNAYVPQKVTLHLEAEVTLEGRALVDNEFSFTLSRDGENGDIVAVGSNDAEGKVIFSAFEITGEDMADAEEMANGTKQKIFTYVMKESDNHVPGVTIDPVVHTVYVIVTDDDKGTLRATVVDPNHEVMVFNNTFTAEEPKDTDEPPQTDVTKPTEPPATTVTQPQPDTPKTTVTQPDAPDAPKQPDVPKTGERSFVWIAAAMMALAGVAVIRGAARKQVS